VHLRDATAVESKNTFCVNDPLVCGLINTQNILH